MLDVPDDLKQRLHESGQEHVLAWWSELDGPRRRVLLDQLRGLDLARLRRLFEDHDTTTHLPPLERVSPLPGGSVDPAARGRGEEALRRGEVAVLLVAGGQGSRLGFDKPKGLYPVGPVSGHSLFQLHAEKVVALGRRYGKVPPLLIMTSDATHAETVAFFQENRYFGLQPDGVVFFQQGTMPALDLSTGRLLMEEKGKLFTSPNGHGGTLTALAEHGLLAQLRDQGISQVFYFQVDNPLVKVAEPAFLGQHLRARADVSTKVVAKRGPTDRMGNLVVVDGRCTIVEYSDLPREWAERCDDQDRLYFWAGNTAIHIFSVEFLEHVTGGAGLLPFHVARKKVPYVDDKGMPVQPTKENALKFEMFIFDVLPLAERWTAAETTRPEEFVPLKNAAGEDSPEAVRIALTEEAASWLGRAGVSVPRGDDGRLTFPVEVSPLLALDAEELRTKLDPAWRIQGPTFIH